jgi:ATP-dependent Clp protease ATP-binding subunit ClpA
MSPMNAESRLSPDAAIVLGLASTAMPFARSPEAEAERWLRILRLHGKAGSVLSAMGVSEAPLEAPEVAGAGEPTEAAQDQDRDPVTRVTEQAARIASQRGADAIGTTDVLVAVMNVYGADFDRVLHAHGADRDEVVRRLRVE